MFVVTEDSHMCRLRCLTYGSCIVPCRRCFDRTNTFIVQMAFVRILLIRCETITVGFNKNINKLTWLNYSKPRHDASMSACVILTLMWCVRLKHGEARIVDDELTSLRAIVMIIAPFCLICDAIWQTSEGFVLELKVIWFVVVYEVIYWMTNTTEIIVLLFSIVFTMNIAATSKYDNVSYIFSFVTSIKNALRFQQCAWIYPR